jgi:hypothetical protein
MIGQPGGPSACHHHGFITYGDDMTRIDIDRLSEAELVDLNHRIVERLRFLEQMRAHARMLDFGIGDRVCFESGSHGLIEGILTRYNKRTVTIITDDRRQWNVSPGFLRKAVRPDRAEAAATNVIKLK